MNKRPPPLLLFVRMFFIAQTLPLVLARQEGPSAGDRHSMGELALDQPWPDRKGRHTTRSKGDVVRRALFPRVPSTPAQGFPKPHKVAAHRSRSSLKFRRQAAGSMEAGRPRTAGAGAPTKVSVGRKLSLTGNYSKSGGRRNALGNIGSRSSRHTSRDEGVFACASMICRYVP